MAACLNIQESKQFISLDAVLYLQPEKNQIFLSITVIFLYKTEGGGKKPPLSGNILLDNILLRRAGMAQTLIKWEFEGM